MTLPTITVVTFLATGLPRGNAVEKYVLTHDDDSTAPQSPLHVTS